MWKKVGNKPSYQNKSTVSLASQEANKEQLPRKSRNQTNSHTNILIQQKQHKQTRNNQILGRSRSHLQLPEPQTYKDNKINNEGHQESLIKSLEQKTKTETINQKHKDPQLIDKIKTNIKSVMKTVHEIKMNQQLMKNDYREKVLQFKQLMAKLENVVSQKPHLKVDQALQQIQKYRTRINDFEQRREDILKNYGLVWNELL